MHFFNMKQTVLSDRQLSHFLFGACLFIFVMVVLGGMTRLTGSGLSMVEWRPVSGVLPPLTHEDWIVFFENYQRSPEYLKINKGMTLEGFKHIFWLEYIHRLWGRLIGLYFLLPLFLAWRKSFLRQTYLPFLLAIWILGGLQGCVGWLMVKSGLIDDPHVSPYALAVHFLLALLTYAMTFSAAIRLYPKKQGLPVILPTLSWILGLFVLTSFYGALVAGHKAGLIYNTFPLMEGRWMPEEAWFYKSTLLNLFVNPVTVQWVHRLLAVTLMVSVIVMIKSNWSKSLTFFQRQGLLAAGFFVVVQMSVGIAALLYQVPTFLALLHQAGSLILFSSLIMIREASKSAATPGSVLPSNHSRKAPPAVER